MQKLILTKSTTISKQNNLNSTLTLQPWYQIMLNHGIIISYYTVLSNIINNALILYLVFEQLKNILEERNFLFRSVSLISDIGVQDGEASVIFTRVQDCQTCEVKAHIFNFFHPRSIVVCCIYIEMW